MAGEQDAGLQGRQAVERLQVGGDVALGVGDHRAAVAEDQVARKDGAILRNDKAQVVGAVTRGVERGQVDSARAHDVAVVQFRVAPHRRVVRGGETLRERKVVGVRVRDQDDADGFAGEALVERREMGVVVGAGVDHRDHRARLDDPGVGAGPRVRPRIRGHDAGD